MRVPIAPINKVFGVANILDKTTALTDCNLNFKLKTHLMMNTDGGGVGLLEIIIKWFNSTKTL